MSSISIEGECLQETFVAPQWLPDGNSFWYRQRTSPGRYAFIYVDIPQKTSGPAFDHAALAKELSEHAGTEIDPESLPFTWIEVGADTSVVHFTYQGRKWEYNPVTGLCEWDGRFAHRKRGFLRKMIESKTLTNSSVNFSFTNHTRANLKMYWVDYDGKSVFYRGIGPGDTKRQRSQPGHIWKLKSDSPDDAEIIYRIPKGQDILIVDEMDLDKTAAEENDENDPAADQQVEERPEAEDKDDKGGEIFVLDDNLWMEDEDKNRFQLSDHPPRYAAKGDDTEEGGKQEDNNPKSPEEDLTYDERMIFKSPDGKFVIAWQHTPFPDEKIWLLNYATGDKVVPQLKERAFRKAGDRVREDRPRLFNLTTKVEVLTEDDLFTGQYNLYNVGWGENGEYRFIFNQRGHQCMRVLAISCDGSIRVLLEEKSETFIDYLTKLYYQVVKVDGSEKMIWASERDGHNHLYMLDLEKGQIQHQITSGNWNVNRVEHIDHDTGELWISAYGFNEDEDPYHIHLVHVRFDGTECWAVTEGDGTHLWNWSPDKRFFIDTASRVDLPPRTTVRSAKTGELLVVLNEVKSEDLKEKGWVPLERFSALGRDGKTLIYGVIALPRNFDKTKTYPVLEYIYAKPHEFYTPKRFGQGGGLYSWATFVNAVTVQIDGMGTNWRSKTFHNVCYKNLSDAGLPDRILWMKEAAKTRPWMDLSRVGIVGTSAGATNTVSAILHHGDFYKVAAADSGSHDIRIDYLSWAESCMGYPVDQSYIDHSNLTHAGKLEGQLMLVVGGLDTNVNPAGTMRLVQALNEQDKDYELVFIPDGHHGCGCSGYGHRRIVSFFKKHLGSPGESAAPSEIATPREIPHPSGAATPAEIIIGSEHTPSSGDAQS
ncbi:hypothetical protein V2G26_001535 [Clonostachys chloroleuca]